MSCKKWCLNSQTKWILAGSVSVTLVLTIAMVLGLTLHRGTQTGKNSYFPSSQPTPAISHPLPHQALPIHLALFSSLILSPTNLHP